MNSNSNEIVKPSSSSSELELDLDRPNLEDYLPSGSSIQEPRGKLRLYFFFLSLSLFGCWENNGILMWLLQGSEFVFLVNLHISFNYLLQPWFAWHFSYLNWGCWCHYRCKLLFLFQLMLFIYVSLTSSSSFFIKMKFWFVAFFFHNMGMNCAISFCYFKIIHCFGIYYNLIYFFLLLLR